MYSNNSPNGTTLEIESQKDDEVTSKSLQTTAYAFVFILSLIGNSIVLTIIKKNLNGSRKVVTNLLIAHMALADTLTTICGLPIMMWRIWRGDEWIVEGILGKVLCKVDVFIIETAFAVSAFTIALIALERYLVIFYPTKKILTCSRAFGVGLLAWFLSAIFYCPKLYTLTIKKRKDIYVCSSQDRLIRPWRLIEALFYLILLFFTFALYLAIIIKVRYYNSSSPTTPYAHPRKLVREKMNRRVLCQSLVIIFVHYICWIPYLLVYLSCFFSKNTVRFCHKRILIRFLVFFFAYSNAAANPFVYATLSESFRSGFRLLLYQVLYCCDGEKTQRERPVRNQVNLGEQNQLQTLRNGVFDKSTSSAPYNPPRDPPRRETKFELIEMKQLKPRSL